MLTAKQNQKFPFHFFFRFAAEGWGEEAREKCKEIFWFLLPRPKGADEARIIGRQDSIQNAFELCSIHTAIFRKGFQNQKYGRREAPIIGLNSRQTQTPPRFSTLRVAQKVWFDSKF